MIESTYLADLRKKHRTEIILTLVQLSQLCPSSWLTLEELANYLGTDRASLNRSLRKLEDLNLLRRSSISNNGGTWIWWVAKCKGDQPTPNAEPAWILNDLTLKQNVRVPISKRWQWAQMRRIPRQTFRSFLAGNQTILRERWKLVSGPCLIT